MVRMSEDRWPFHIYDEDFLAFREWLKEHDNQMREEGAKAERERIRSILINKNDESCVGEMNSEKCLSYEDNCTLCKFDYASSPSEQGGV